jgi:hypothetical protein
MSTTELLTRLAGIRNPHYFNGRVLTAETLREDQEADRQHRRQLGQALGAGIVHGLEVKLAGSSTVPRPALSVTSGLAFNRNGEAIALPENVTIELVPQTQISMSDAGLFVDCQPPPTPTALTNYGFHILTVRPTSDYREQALKVGLNSQTNRNGQGGAAGCGSRFAVEGVKFFLIQMPLSAGETDTGLRAELVKLGKQIDDDANSLLNATGQVAINLRSRIAANLSKLRNGAAHFCFGTEKLATYATNPFAGNAGESSFLQYGALDELRAKQQLTNCDVPLALLYWTRDGVQFLDMWAVRRRLIESAATKLWNAATGSQWLSEREAMFLQFQDQIDDLRSNLLDLGTAIAITHFRYLPPAGLLPVRENGLRSGLVSTFFTGRPHRDAEFIEGGLLGALFQAASHYDPIDLTQGEMVWLYRVRQNEQNVAALHYLIFTSAFLPYQATARFDVARWDYSNYARCENCQL